MCLYLCLLTVIENEEPCQCVFVFWLFYNAHMHNVNVDTCVEREATVSFKSLSLFLSLSGRHPNTFTTQDGTHEHRTHGIENPIKNRPADKGDEHIVLRVISQFHTSTFFLHSGLELGCSCSQKVRRAAHATQQQKILFSQKTNSVRWNSADDWKNITPQWNTAKSCPTTCPLLFQIYDPHSGRGLQLVSRSIIIVPNT